MVTPAIRRNVAWATGVAVRLFQPPSGLPFNSWYCPYETGDGHVAAFEAGAALTNMEYARQTLVPKGFGAAEYGAFMTLGCKYVNALGEEYIKKYWPEEGKPPRNVCVNAAIIEMREGRGPVFFDCRHLPKEDLDA